MRPYNHLLMQKTKGYDKHPNAAQRAYAELTHVQRPFYYLPPALVGIHQVLDGSTD